MFSLLFFFIGFLMSENRQLANAQLIPIPPSIQGPTTTQFHLVPSHAKNDSSSSYPPPIIEFLTNSLIEGKNVVKVKITDHFDLKYAEIKYVQNGQVVTQGLIRDPNNTYKVLIDAHSPAAKKIIVVNAADTNGKKTTVIKELTVTSFPSSIIGQISNLFFYIGKMVVSIFAPTRH
jgi:hypothetical protein